MFEALTRSSIARPGGTAVRTLAVTVDPPRVARLSYLPRFAPDANTPIKKGPRWCLGDASAGLIVS